MNKKTIICVPTLTRPYQQTLDSIKASVPFMDEAGIEHYFVSEVGCPYISAARATMLRKALDVKADVIVFIDHDVSWSPQDLVKLINTDGDVIAGLYRFKEENEHYMGVLDDTKNGMPIVREDGCIKASRVPAGFLKITRNTVNKFMQAYPHLMYGEACSPFIDLFNHGAHKGAFWGEDYAFSRNWTECGGEIWIVPDLSLDHNNKEIDENGEVSIKTYKGNFHEFMLKQPGGSKDPARLKVVGEN